MCSRRIGLFRLEYDLVSALLGHDGDSSCNLSATVPHGTNSAEFQCPGDPYPRDRSVLIVNFCTARCGPGDTTIQYYGNESTAHLPLQLGCPA